MTLSFALTNKNGIPVASTENINVADIAYTQEIAGSDTALYIRVAGSIQQWITSDAVAQVVTKLNTAVDAGGNHLFQQFIVTNKEGTPLTYTKISIAFADIVSVRATTMIVQVLPYQQMTLEGSVLTPALVSALISAAGLTITGAAGDFLYLNNTTVYNGITLPAATSCILNGSRATLTGGANSGIYNYQFSPQNTSQVVGNFLATYTLTQAFATVDTIDYIYSSILHTNLSALPMLTTVNKAAIRAAIISLMLDNIAVPNIQYSAITVTGTTTSITITISDTNMVFESAYFTISAGSVNTPFS